MIPSEHSFENWRLTLEKEGYTEGLIHQVERTITETPLRIWLLDNSASMNLLDGYRVFMDSPTSKDVRMVKCTRWQELVEAVRYHAQLAALTKAPTSFRLLNSCPNTPSEYTIAHQPIYNVNDMNQQLATITKSMGSIQPTGATPLTAHIYDIRNTVLSMQQALQTRNQHVTLIIATDGLPSDEKGFSGVDEAQLFIHALKMLENLSIGLVIRLCTHEEKVKQFYYNLCPQLKLTIHIIEDFMSEATKIHRYNPWITYSLPVHRIQEFGVIHASLAALKNHTLTPMETRGYCTFLFGPELIASKTDSNQDFSSFLKMLKCVVKKYRCQHWDPSRKKLGYLLDTKLLAKALGQEETCCCCCSIS